MPYRRKKNMPRKKRSNRRYGRRNRNKVQSSFVKGPGSAITADRMFVQLKYFKTYKVVGQPGTNTTIDLRFHGNSIYDCDAAVTAATFSVLGYRALANLYTRFRVHGSKCVAKFMSTANGSSNFGKLAVVPSPASPITSANILSRFPYSKTKLIGGSVGDNIITIPNYMSTKKILGIRNIDSDYDHSGDMNPDGTGILPNVTWFWHVSADSINGTTPFDGSLYVDVELTYYVELFDRVHIQVQDLDDDQTPLEPEDQ